MSFTLYDKNGNAFVYQAPTFTHETDQWHTETDYLVAKLGDNFAGSLDCEVGEDYIRLTPSRLVWVNEAGEELSVLATVNTAVTGVLIAETSIDAGLEYTDVFGSGISVRALLDNTFWTKKIVVTDLASLGTIPDGASHLEIEFTLVTNTDMGGWDGVSTETLSEGRTVAGDLALKRAVVVDADGVITGIEMQLRPNLLVKRIPVATLSDATYPLVTDASFTYGSSYNSQPNILSDSNAYIDLRRVGSGQFFVMEKVENLIYRGRLINRSGTTLSVQTSDQHTTSIDSPFMSWVDKTNGKLMFHGRNGTVATRVSIVTISGNTTTVAEPTDYSGKGCVNGIDPLYWADKKVLMVFQDNNNSNALSAQILTFDGSYGITYEAVGSTSVANWNNARSRAVRVGDNHAVVITPIWGDGTFVHLIKVDGTTCTFEASFEVYTATVGYATITSPYLLSSDNANKFAVVYTIGSEIRARVATVDPDADTLSVGDETSLGTFSSPQNLELDALSPVQLGFTFKESGASHVWRNALIQVNYTSGAITLGDVDTRATNTYAPVIAYMADGVVVMGREDVYGEYTVGTYEYVAGATLKNIFGDQGLNLGA